MNFVQNRYKSLVIYFISLLMVACSTAIKPEDFKNQSFKLEIVKNAESELVIESEILNGYIVEDYRLNKYRPPVTYAPLQESYLLNTSEFLFVPINETNDLPVFSEVKLKPSLSNDSIAEQSFIFYKDPLKAAEVIQSEHKITPEELKSREQSLEMANAVLNDFIAANPSYKAKIESAAGYAVFDITSFTALLYVGGWGYGVIFDKVNNQVIYANYFRAGTGFGVGYIGQYVIYIFHNHLSIQQFIGLGGGLDVGASGTFGIWGKYFSFNPMIDTYQLYKYGANFQGNWGGSVYWRSGDNN